MGNSHARGWGNFLSSISCSAIQNFVWVPLGLYFGTRPTFLLAAMLVVASTVWSAVAQSWTSLVVSRIICGFAASCGEALLATVVKDLFFLHERGWWMGVYMFFFQSVIYIGLLCSGFIITSLGWRWHFWVNAPNLIELSAIACGHLRHCQLNCYFLFLP